MASIHLDLTERKVAVVAIDLHRGHLDMEVATMPTSPDVARRVVAANKRLLEWARRQEILVVHLLTCYRDDVEIASNPFWRAKAADPKATRKNVLAHNIVGMPGVTIMPDLHGDGDLVVDTKKRYDCFLGTDLEFVLRAHAIDTLLITGVNTNSCVLATVTAANVRDYSVLVVEDCVDTMDGPALHAAALLCIKTAFGTVLDSEALMSMATSPGSTTPSLAKADAFP